MKEKIEAQIDEACIEKNDKSDSFKKTKTKIKKEKEPIDYISDMDFLIDCHTHILPNIDDGARSRREADDLIDYSKKRNINFLCMTPHFHPDKDNMNEYFLKRDQAYDRLGDVVNVILGTELSFVNGISKLNNLKDLCIGNTKYILIEMPFDKWNEIVIKEVIELKNIGYIPVIAHFEKYLQYKNLKNLVNLKNEGCMLQINGSYFLDKKTRKDANKLLEKGLVDFVASDCHRVDSQPQNLPDALNYIIANCNARMVYILLNNYEALCEAIINGNLMLK